jgi:hypothetical protein
MDIIILSETGNTVEDDLELHFEQDDDDDPEEENRVLRLIQDLDDSPENPASSQLESKYP